MKIEFQNPWAILVVIVLILILIGGGYKIGNIKLPGGVEIGITPPSTQSLNIVPTDTSYSYSQDFSTLSFCYRSELDTQNLCTTSRQLFIYPAPEICVSWIPSPQYLGSSFQRVWRNNTIGTTKSNEDFKTFGCLSSSPSLGAGQYDVELFVNGVLVQKGSFTIQK